MTPKERAVGIAGGGELAERIEAAINAAVTEEREEIARMIHAFAFNSENRDENFLLAARLIENRIQNRAYLGAEEVSSGATSEFGSLG